MAIIKENGRNSMKNDENDYFEDMNDDNGKQGNTVLDIIK